MNNTPNLDIKSVLNRIDMNESIYHDVDDKLTKVAQAVAFGPKNAKGKVTIILSVCKTAHGQVQVIDEVTHVLPKRAPKDGSTFFVDVDGALSLQPKDQQILVEG